MLDDERTARIRILNDALRTSGIGGRIVVTAGIAALGREAVMRILGCVAAFDAFTPDNDPHGEHDCAVLTVEGRELIFKIDYYDRELRFLSPDPGDPTVTVRILTVMLASEY